MSPTSQFSKKLLITFFSLLSIIGYGFFAFAVLPDGTPPPTGGYDTGTNSILDPGCSPYDVDCFVKLPTASGGTTNPAGSNGYLQYNDNGVFGADGLFVRDPDNQNTYIGKDTSKPVYQYTVDLGFWIADSTTSGNFIDGETVIGSVSGATAVYQGGVTNGNNVFITYVSGNFIDGEDMIGQTSGAIAEFSLERFEDNTIITGDTVVIMSLNSGLGLKGVVISASSDQAVIETTHAEVGMIIASIQGNTFSDRLNSIAGITSRVQIGNETGNSHFTLNDSISIMNGMATGNGISLASSSDSTGSNVQLFLGDTPGMGGNLFVLSTLDNDSMGSAILGSKRGVYDVLSLASGDVFGQSKFAGIDLESSDDFSSIYFKVSDLINGDSDIGLLKSDGSIQFGLNSLAEARNSVAIGSSVNSSGKGSVVIGNDSRVYNEDSFVIGNNIDSNWQGSFAIGSYLNTHSGYETVMGMYNTQYNGSSDWSNIDRLFTIGNGTDSGTHNAYTLFKDGSFVFNDDNFQNNNSGTEQNIFYFNYGNHDGNGNIQNKTAIRLGSTLNNEWDINSLNVGDKSIAIGFGFPDYNLGSPVASGFASFALGVNSIASGDASFAMLGEALGTASFAFGGRAVGQNSTAFSSSLALGQNSFAFAGGGDLGSDSANVIAEGDNSVAWGYGSHAYSNGETAFGSYNTVYVPTGTSNDRRLVVGNEYSDALTILKNGQTGIAINNFETNTNGNIFQVGDGGTNIIGYVDNGTGNWVAISDERKKENITNITYGLDTVLKLIPKSYTMLSTGESSIGFIAQEVQSIVPESVFGSEEKGYGMSYATLTPVLVKAIQEMNLRITDLNNMTEVNPWRDGLIAWLENTANGIRSIVVKEKICIEDECLTKNDIRALLQMKSAIVFEQDQEEQDEKDTTTEVITNQEETSDNDVPDEIMVVDQKVQEQPKVENVVVVPEVVPEVINEQGNDNSDVLVENQEKGD